MNYATAYDFILAQGLPAIAPADSLLTRLEQGLPPIPGQVTSLLLALKVVQEAQRDEPLVERRLAWALYRLAGDSRRYFDQGQRQGVDWPPLLDDDLHRIQQGVGAIFASAGDRPASEA